MKVFVLILLLVVARSSHAQEFNKLDSSKNFQGFVFGTSAEQYNNLQLDLTISYGTKYYKYKGRRIKEFFGFKTHQVNIGFDNDALHYIDLYFKNLDQEAFDLLLQRLQYVYGEATEFGALDKGVTQALEWTGDHLVMQLYKYNSEAPDFDDKNMTVLIVTRN